MIEELQDSEKKKVEEAVCLLRSVMVGDSTSQADPSTSQSQPPLPSTSQPPLPVTSQITSRTGLNDQGSILNTKRVRA